MLIELRKGIILYQPGEFLSNKYRIETLVGKGAFAEVYRATHLSLGATRAIKVISRSTPGINDADFQDIQSRFWLEAQLGARLDHPNIIRVYDFEQDGENAYLVMEYASGGSLAEEIQKTRLVNQYLPVDSIVKVAMEVAQGLCCLHNIDAVHRDLKPSNILFDASGNAKISDFGLAQVPGGPSLRSQTSRPIPHPGTPAYMSPEQESTGGYLAPASDVYSLGLILFEMATGRMNKNLSQGTTMRTLRPDVPMWLDDLVVRMLSADPRNRPWNGCEVAKLIKKLIGKDKLTRSNKQEQQREQERLRKEKAEKAKHENEEISQTKNRKEKESGVAKITPDNIKKESTVYPGTSLILKPHLKQLLGPLPDVTIQGLLSTLDTPQIVNHAILYGSQYIITGYNSFGGTTLTREIVRSIQRGMAKYARGETVLTIRLELDDIHKNWNSYKVSFQTEDDNFKDKFSVYTNGEADKGHSLKDLLGILYELRSGNTNKSTFLREIENLGVNLTPPPSRFLISVDKIIDLDTLMTIIQQPIFGKERVVFILTIDRERLNRWCDKTPDLLSTNLQVKYIPCLWEPETSLVDQIVDNIVTVEQGNEQNEDNHLLIAFKKHLAFLGRGALGTTFKEIQKMEYWGIDLDRGVNLIAFHKLKEKRLEGSIYENALLQDVLTKNWQYILGPNFQTSRPEDEDRAKLGVYELVDWIRKKGTFKLEQIREASEQAKILITSSQEIREEVIFNLLNVLVENKYLKRLEDGYNVIWGRGITKEIVRIRKLNNDSDTADVISRFISEIREVLSKRDEFSNPAHLRALFAAYPLSSFQSGLPEASTPCQRVDMIIDYLKGKRTQNGDSVLIILLKVIMEKTDHVDARYQELVELIQELEAACS
jgi:serine/threonine protein kinase